MPEVGDAWITVHADGSGLYGEIRSIATRAAAGAKIELDVELDDKGVIAETKALAKAASTSITIDAKVVLDKATLARAQAAARSLFVKEVPVSVDLKAASVVRAKAAIERILGDAKVRVHPDVDHADLDKITSTLLRNRDVHWNLKAQFDPQFSTRRVVDGLTRELESHPVEIPLEILNQGRNFVASIEALRARYKVNPIEMPVKVNVDTLGSRAEIAALAARYRANPLELPVKLKTTLLDKQFMRAPVNIPVHFLFKETLLGEIALLKGAFEANPLNMPVQVDFKAAEAKAKLAASLALFKATPAQIPVKLNLNASTAIAQVAALAAVFKANPVTLPVQLNMRSLPILLSRMRQSVTNATSSMAAGIGNAFKSVFKGIGGGGGGGFGAIGVVLKFTAAQAALLGAAAAIALPYVEALGVAVAGLAVDVGSAGLALAGFAGAGLVAIGSAAAATAVGLQGLGAAYKAVAKVQELQAQKGKRTKAQQAALTKAIDDQHQALSGLAGSAQEFVQSTVRLQGPWKDFTRSIQGKLFEGLGADLENTARVLLPALDKSLGGVATTVNQVARDFLTWARSDEGVKTLTTVLGNSKRTIRDLGETAGNAAVGLLNLLTGGKKNANSLSTAFVDLSQRFEDWTKAITTIGPGGTSPLQDFFVTARQNLRKVGGLFESTGGLISAFWANWTNAGAAGRTDILGDLTGQLQDWAAALRDPKNAGAIKEWVANAKQNFTDLVGAVGSVVGAINSVSEAMQGLNDIVSKGISWDDAFSQKTFGKQGDFHGILGPISDALLALPTTPGNKAARQIGAWIKSQFDAIPPIDAPVTVTPVVTVADIKAANRNRVLQQVSEAIATANATGKIKLGFDPPTSEEINTAARKALLAGKKKFTVDGSKYKINAKGKVELVTAAPTEQEIQEAATKALAKNKNAKGFTVKGFKFDIKADGTITPHITVKKPKPSALQQTVNEALKKVNLARTALGGKKFVIKIDPSIQVGKLDISDGEKKKIKEAIDRALKTGKGQTIKIDGKKFVVDVEGNIVSIKPYTGPKPTVDVVPKVTGLPGKAIPQAASLTLPVRYGDLPPFPTLPSPSVEVGTGYQGLPQFPALPHPNVTVGTGYAGLPKFPALPHPKVTIGLAYGKLPGLPALPHPVIHVKVVIDDPAAKGVVAQPLGGFKPSASGVYVTHGPERRIIGEAGPEAVVPLRASQTLDPDVARLLRAVAFSRGMGGGPEVVQNILLPTGDPEAVAMAVANRLALVRTV